MAVYIPINIAGVQDAQEKPSKTYRLDLDAGRIIGFVDNDAVPAGAEVIDAAGAYVAPGLIDVPAF